jgi:hypothetical protein
VSDDRVRVELGFAGGQIVSAFVDTRSADALEVALGGGTGSAPVVVLETEDGPLHVVVAQIAYYKRTARAARAGFSSG